MTLHANLIDAYICKRCKDRYDAGHICNGPQGLPLERAVARLHLCEVLRRDERDAVLSALAEASP